MFYVLACIALAALLQTADYVYHRRDLTFLSALPVNTPIREFRKRLGAIEHGQLDDIFAVFPFLWSYLLIAAAVLLFGRLHYAVAKGILVLFVTGRFRSLQEAGHFAVHGCLSKNMKLGLLLANVFYQFPAFMPEASIRREIHVRQHHHSVNMAHDPDVKEMLDKGFKPGISRYQFWRGVFYPLTLKGIRDRLVECAVNSWADRKSVNLVIRVAVVLALFSTFLYFGLYQELLLLYVLPVLITYPAFYWIAHISLHRWFEDCPADIDYDHRELHLGRPTEFHGVGGAIIRNNIFPLGDSYHLAHSLFPTVRWTHLPQVDKIMKTHCPQYSADATSNLFFSSRGGQSIISALKRTFLADIR